MINIIKRIHYLRYSRRVLFLFVLRYTLALKGACGLPSSFLVAMELQETVIVFAI